MSKNIPRSAPLQRVVAIEITDPAEIAAAEEEFRRDRQLRQTNGGTTPAEALRLCQRLSVEARLSLVRDLASTLPADQQGHLIAHLMTQASPDVLRALDAERARLNGQ